VTARPAGEGTVLGLAVALWRAVTALLPARTGTTLVGKSSIA
jgi:hypothetical protein